MALNQEKLDQLLEDAEDLVTRYLPKKAPAPTWYRNLEILSIFTVIVQLWQDPNGTTGEYVRAVQPVIVAAFEMGREAERDGTA